MTNNLFNTEPKLSSRIRLLKSNLRILKMPLAQKALQLMIEEMCIEKGFSRKGSGEHYYHHVADVALTLINFGETDEVTIVAAILHDAVEDVPWITFEYIVREYGQEVADTVALVTKNPNIDYKTDKDAWTRDLQEMLEFIRAVKIKISDRVNNFNTLDGMPLENQYLKALETETYFLPFIKVCLDMYPEHASFFVYAKTTIKPHLIKIKKSYERELELLKEIEKLKNEIEVYKAEKAGRENIMIKEFNKIGPVLDTNMVAIFNKEKISEPEVTNVIDKGLESEKIIFATKEQFETVF